MIELKWIDHKALEILQGQSIAMFGGLPGLRDSALLDSALARPQLILAYNVNPSLAGLAAAYAFGICRNHPFADGNKRTGLLAMLMFLEINDYVLVIADTQSTLETIRVIERVASSDLSEEQLTQWVEQHCRHKKKMVLEVGVEPT